MLGRAAALCAASLLVPASAMAFWTSPGLGTGTAAADSLPAGPLPTATAAGRSVTVSWTQVSFRLAPLGSYASAGYVIKRYPASGGSAQTPAGTCGALVSGSATGLSCQDTNVAIGTWRYSVTPVLGSWTGAESSVSASVTTTIDAPSLTAVTALNPTGSATTGDVQLTWSAVSGAAGYNVYRRTAAGSYNFAAPLNGASPVTGTGYTDSGAGLAANAGYDYVVRAVQGSPAAESPNSNELAATTWSRPAAPSGTPTATPRAGAQIALSWSAVAGAAGYNVYRRTTAGSYNYASPLNGASPVTSASYTDTTAVNGTAYDYVVRTVVAGSAGAPIESVSSTESAAATADSTAPLAPVSVTVGAAAGPLLAIASCGYAASTRFVNAAGRAAVPVTVTIATPETGETVTVSATTGAATPVTVTVPATATNVTATLDLSTLADGAVTVSARTADALGNASASVGPSTATVKDTAAVLGSLQYADANKGTADTLAGASECGAHITAVETAGTSVGSTYPAAGTFTVGSTGSFSGFAVDSIKGVGQGTAYGYDVTATDLAGNAATVAITGTDTA